MRYDEEDDSDYEHVNINKEINIFETNRIRKTYNKKEKKSIILILKITKLIDPLTELNNMIGMNTLKIYS